MAHFFPRAAATCAAMAISLAMPAGAASPQGGQGGDCLEKRCAVTVSNGRFLRDGKPWIPKGVVIVGFVAPRGYIKGIYQKAHDAWGETLLRDLKAIGVDTIRFNVSIAGLDPSNSMPDGKMTAGDKRAYVAEIVDAASLARRQGMNVIMTLLGGEPSGYDKSAKVPGPESERAWSVLAPAFMDSPSVILNAFNEPVFRDADEVDTDDSPWRRWSAGYQILVTAIRKAGANNVILLNGLSISRVWRKNTDAMVPKDPVGQLAYDIHPFPTASTQKNKRGRNKFQYLTTEDIDYWLGGWCDRHACVASAFFAGTSEGKRVTHCFTGGKDGEQDTPKLAAKFVDYFTKRNIGVLIFAGDWPFRVFDKPGQPGAKLSSFSGFTGCSDESKNIGPGELMKNTWLSLR